jgi:hypothetical protein
MCFQFRFKNVDVTNRSIMFIGSMFQFLGAATEKALYPCIYMYLNYNVVLQNAICLRTVEGTLPADGAIKVLANMSEPCCSLF